MSPQNVKVESDPQLPWWRVRMVWLVLSGPAIVVVAALLTAVIAVRGADPVIAHDDGGQFAEKSAVQGRNHAATGHQK
jgi:hypothetical protein